MPPAGLTGLKWLLVNGALLLVMVLALVAISIWFMNGNLEESVPGVGQLVPEGQIRKVSSPLDGLVMDVLVNENQSVKKGQVLAILNPEALTLDETSAESQASLLRGETQALEQAYQSADGNRIPSNLGRVPSAWLSASQQTMQARLRQAKLQVDKNHHDLKESQAKLSQAQTTLSTSEALLKQFKALFDEGALSEKDYRTYEQKVLEQRGQVSILKEEVQSRQAALAQAKEAPSEIHHDYQQRVLDRLLQQQRVLAQAEGDEAKSQLALTQQKILSPVDGVILEQSIRGVGDVVKASQPLFSIVPKEEGLIAELRVTNRDLAYLHAKQRVAMRLDALPYTVWGRLYGTILSISPSTHTPPTSSPSTSAAPQQPFYTVRVKPEQLVMTNRQGMSQPLRSGMTLSADIITRQKSLWSFFLEPIEGQVDAAFREPTTK